MSLEKQKAALKLVGQAAKALDLAFYNKTTNHAKELFGVCEQEERQHRACGNWHEGRPNAASVKQCARQLGVKWVADYLVSETYPAPVDFLITKKSCLIAAGIAARYRDEILAAWKGFDIAELAALDYCLLVNPEKEK